MNAELSCSSGSRSLCQGPGRHMWRTPRQKRIAARGLYRRGVARKVLPATSTIRAGATAAGTSVHHTHAKLRAASIRSATIRRPQLGLPKHAKYANIPAPGPAAHTELDALAALVRVRDEAREERRCLVRTVPPELEGRVRRVDVRPAIVPGRKSSKNVSKKDVQTYLSPATTAPTTVRPAGSTALMSSSVASCSASDTAWSSALVAALRRAVSTPRSARLECEEGEEVDAAIPREREKRKKVEGSDA